MRRGLLLGFALVAGVWPGAAHGGAWTSYLHTYGFSGLVAANDTLWCATREAGLVRFDPSLQRFDSFTREPGGLVSNQIGALAIDRSGRLWAGTLGTGLSRLAPDRKTWDLLSVFDGLPSDTITVLEAQGDTVYIGTTGGIALWDGNTIAGAIPDGVNPSPFTINTITGIAQLGDSVWVSTPDGIYVSRLSQVPQTWNTVNQNLVSNNILGLASDGSSLFAYGNNVPYIFHFDTDLWGFAGNYGAIGTVVRLDDGNGVVTAATDQGIYRWNPALAGGSGDWEAIQVGAPYASSIDPANVGARYAVASDPARGVTYAANGLGVHVLTPGCTQCPTYAPPGPLGNNIINLGLQPLSNGSQIYVNTFDEGVSRFDGKQWRHWPKQACTLCDTTFIFPIYTFSIQVTPAGKKWVACWSGPIEEFDDSVSPASFIHHYEAQVGEALAPERHTFGWATTVDPDGGVWFGLETNGQGNPVPPAIGLDYYNASGAFVRNFRPSNTNPSYPMRGGQIRGLTVDHRGRFWVGYTGQGVQYFDWPLPPSGVPDFLNLPGTLSYYVQSLRTYGDSLWVLTTSDLRRYDARSLNPAPNSVFSPPGETAQNAIRPLEVGPDGSVWLGTGSGLRVYHPGGAIEDFKTSNSALASDAVRAIFVEPKTGVAWIGTSAGLNRYDPHWVPPPVSSAPSLRVSIYPNPLTLTGIGTPLRLSGSSDVYEGEVYDLNGRVVSHFSGVRDGQTFWSGKDDHGSVVKPGIYFVRVTSRGHSATARVAVVR